MYAGARKTVVRSVARPAARFASPTRPTGASRANSPLKPAALSLLVSRSGSGTAFSRFEIVWWCVKGTCDESSTFSSSMSAEYGMSRLTSMCTKRSSSSAPHVGTKASSGAPAGGSGSPHSHTSPCFSHVA